MRLRIRAYLSYNIHKKKKNKITLDKMYLQIKIIQDINIYLTFEDTVSKVYHKMYSTIKQNYHIILTSNVMIHKRAQTFV